jgi:signal recognition particle GTPase
MRTPRKKAPPKPRPSLPREDIGGLTLPRRRQSMGWWHRLPAAGKAAGALAAIGALIGTLAATWVSLGFPYPPLRPAYDTFVETKVVEAKKEVEKKVEDVSKEVKTISGKADRNNLDQLESKLLTLDVHYSLTNAQLTAIKRDPAFEKSYSLKNQAAEYEGRLNSINEQKKAVQDKIRQERN